MSQPRHTEESGREWVLTAVGHHGCAAHCVTDPAVSFTAVTDAASACVMIIDDGGGLWPSDIDPVRFSLDRFAAVSAYIRNHGAVIL